ncbi:hypothetical protein D9756_005007 [Leucocoprinus leucothites]|uniref:Uncharacterized protein n=1 Tax=Leucocoprinus leucothites TaxID=201217 RepID=A0A8H5GA03_9AGAR|nr:hypothetical protein D9756_005007 [Leucoagaricus leucothites]
MNTATAVNSIMSSNNNEARYESARPPPDQTGLPPPIPLPSSFAPPTMVDDLPQQGATQPGNGQTVRAHGDHELGGDRTGYPSRDVQPVPTSASGPTSTGQDRIMDSPPRDSGESFKKVPFKEQVIGVAQKTRGTLLGKPGLKEHGQKILEGEITHEEP